MSQEKKFKGPLANWRGSSNPLFIKPEGDVFDGVHYSIGYFMTGIQGITAPTFVTLMTYSRKRDCFRALRNIGYVQEGARWVSAHLVQQRSEAAYAFLSSANSDGGID